MFALMVPFRIDGLAGRICELACCEACWMLNRKFPPGMSEFRGCRDDWPAELRRAPSLEPSRNFSHRHPIVANKRRLADPTPWIKTYINR